MATIEKNGKSYRITVSAGCDLAGKQIRHRKTWRPPEGMTNRQIEKELKRQVVLFEEFVKSGRYVDSSITFAQFSQKWLDEYATEHLRPTTLRHYIDCLTRINAAMGHLRLDRIQPQHLLKFYKNLNEKGIRGDTKYHSIVDLRAELKKRNITQTKFTELAGVSIGTVKAAVHGKNIAASSAQAISKALNAPIQKLFEPDQADRTLASSTVQYYHRVISSILSTAVQWQLLLLNPCERVKPPKLERTEAKYLDDEQATELLEALEAEPPLFRTLYSLVIYTGMRRGEACGLCWQDIDLDNGIIDINKSALYTPEKGVFDDDTKNVTSRRVIKIPTPAVDLLREYRAYQATEKFKLGDKWKGGDKVFTTAEGVPIHPDTATGHFSKFIKKTDLPYVTLHSLRHTNATLMIANGTDIKTVSKRLGHANVSTTGNIYTHAIKTADELAAERLTDLFNSKKHA